MGVNSSTISDQTGGNLAAVDAASGDAGNRRLNPAYPVFDLEVASSDVYMAGGTAAAFDAGTGALLWSLHGNGNVNPVAYLDARPTSAGTPRR